MTKLGFSFFSIVSLVDLPSTIMHTRSCQLFYGFPTHHPPDIFKERIKTWGPWFPDCCTIGSFVESSKIPVPGVHAC